TLPRSTPTPQPASSRSATTHRPALPAQKADKAPVPLPETPPSRSRSPQPQPPPTKTVSSAAKNVSCSSAATSDQSQCPASPKDTGSEWPSHSTTAAPTAVCTRTCFHLRCSSQSYPGRCGPRT